MLSADKPNLDCIMMHTPFLENETETFSSIQSTIRAFKDHLASSSEVTEMFLKNIEDNPELNAFITVTADLAREQARQSDARIAAGKALPLDGLPIAVKDNFCMADVRTSAGSKMLENFIPTYESTLTKKLLDAGAVIVGKTNMDEFAMGSSTETSFFGPTLNPEARRLGLTDRVPGGSSGGSAAAVSANMALAALGTDTGGSIRQPAAFCGIVGFKPTYGVCSRYGIISYASSLDQAGLFCNSVEDVAIIMDVIAGTDPLDSTSLEKRSYNFENALSNDPRPLRIGLPKEVIEAGNTEETSKIWQCAEKIALQMKAEIAEVSLPTFRHALPAYYVVALSEASSNLARYDGVKYGYRCLDPKDITDMYERTRSEGFGSEVKRRIMLGSFALSAGHYDAYYLRALKVRKKLSDEFVQCFEEVDFLFMPTTPKAAFPLNSNNSDPIEMFLQDVYTVPVNMAGLPAISIPVTNDRDGMPLSLQIVGPSQSDEGLVRAASSVELAAGVLGLHDNRNSRSDT